jgi:hypothetical protein
MKIALFIFLLTLSYISAVVDENVLKSINQLKKEVKKKEKLALKSENNEEASVVQNKMIPVAISYYQLGMKIQENWLSKQIPGTSITDALEAYEKATQYAGNSVFILLPIILSQGVLLRMMGRGEESISAYDGIIKKYPLYPIDYAALEYNRADTLLMMGKVNDSIKAFEKSFSKVGCKTERYYGYISALKELGTLTKDDWKAVLTKLKKIEKYCILDGEELNDVSEQNQEEEDYEDDVITTVSLKKSLVYQDYQQGLKSEKPSDFYYAIYNVYEKVGDLSNAWYYLEKGKIIERNYRPTKFNREEVLYNFNSSKMIFTHEMLSSFPNIEDEVDSSNLPIFVVGMMRSGSTLLETMLDSHPSIWGMGEDSMFNANLTFLRDAIVRTTSSNQASLGVPGSASASQYYEASNKLKHLLLDYGKSTVQSMKETAHNLYYVESNKDIQQLKYIVDKMLFNYKNIRKFSYFVYIKVSLFMTYFLCFCVCFIFCFLSVHSLL